MTFALAVLRSTELPVILSLGLRVITTSWAFLTSDLDRIWIWKLQNYGFGFGPVFNSQIRNRIWISKYQIRSSLYSSLGISWITSNRTAYAVLDLFSVVSHCSVPFLCHHRHVGVLRFTSQELIGCELDRRVRQIFNFMKWKHHVPGCSLISLTHPHVRSTCAFVRFFSARRHVCETG